MLSLDSTSLNPRALGQLSTHVTYVIGRNALNIRPHLVTKFRPQYGDLHWPQTWAQIHLQSMDRSVVDLNWRIAHGVLYTATRLAHSFGMAKIDPSCHCQFGDEILEHLFFDCSYAQLLLGWVYFLFLTCDERAQRFTAAELLFCFSAAKRKRVPDVIVWLLNVVKHALWVARNDFRFRRVRRTEAQCLQAVISRTKFLLKVLAGRCRSPSQIRAFEKQWLASSTLGHFEGEELVFSF